MFPGNGKGNDRQKEAERQDLKRNDLNHAVSKKVSIYTNDTTFNALSVCRSLRQLHLGYHGRQIVIVLDNASYQRCKLVRGYARVLGVELLFPPPCSPNLNLIERSWEYVKKRVLYSTFHNDHDAFRREIGQCVKEAFIKDRAKFSTLLSGKFRSFEKVEVLTV